MPTASVGENGGATDTCTPMPPIPMLLLMLLLSLIELRVPISPVVSLSEVWEQLEPATYLLSLG